MTLTGILYVNNLMLKMETEMPSLKVDPGACLQYINDERRAVFNRIYMLKPWMHMKQKLAVAPPFTFATADRCIRVINVWNPNVSPPGAGIEMSIAERAMVNQSTIIPGTTTFPKWTVEQGTTGIKVVTYPGVLSIATVNIGYIESPADLAYTDTESVIPWEFQEMVILGALGKMYEKLAGAQSVDVVSEDNKQFIEAYKKTFYNSLSWDRVSFPSSTPQL